MKDRQNLKIKKHVIPALSLLDTMIYQSLFLIYLHTLPSPTDMAMQLKEN